MSREEIEKLLGGYATGTLTEAERRALLEAALDDQSLFEALAKEEPLREVFADPAARRQLLAALEPPEVWRVRAWRWLRQPAGLALAGGLTAVLIVAGLALRTARAPVPQQFSRVQMAEVRTAPQPTETAAPVQGVPLPKAPAPPQKRASEIRREVPAAEPEMVRAPDVSQLESGKDLAIAAPAPAFPAPAARGALAQTRYFSSQAVRVMPYTLLLKGANGAYAPVPVSQGFHTGDALRIRVEPGMGGYAYLFQRDGEIWRTLSNQRVEGAQPFLLPAGGDLEYDEPGRKELLLVLSPAEESALTAANPQELDALAPRTKTKMVRRAIANSHNSGLAGVSPEQAQKTAFEITLEYH